MTLVKLYLVFGIHHITIVIKMIKFETIRKELKEEFMKRNWNSEQYHDVYGMVLKFIEVNFKDSLIISDSRTKGKRLQTEKAK